MSSPVLNWDPVEFDEGGGDGVLVQLNFEYVEVCPVFWRGVRREWHCSSPGVNEGFSSGVNKRVDVCFSVC